MNASKIIFVLAMALVGSSYLSAQKFQIRQFRAEQGLSSNRIINTQTDRSGFLWIQAHYGLNRWDGNHFSAYTVDPNDNFSIGSNFIIKMIETPNKELWFLHSNGLCKFRKDVNGFDHIKTKELGLSENEFLNNFMHWRSNEFVLSTSRRMFVLDVKSNKITYLKLPAFNDPSVSFVRTDSVTMIVYLDSKLFSYNLRTHETKPLNNDMLKTCISPYLIDIEAISNKVFITTYNRGLLMYDLEEGTFKQINTPHATFKYDPIRSLKRISHDQFVCTSETRVYLFNSDKEIFETIYEEAPESNRIVQGVSYSKGNYWVSTSTGLLLLTPQHINLNQELNLPKKNGPFATVQGNPLGPGVVISDYTSHKMYLIDNNGSRLVVPLQDSKNIKELRYTAKDYEGNGWIISDSEVWHAEKGINESRKIQIGGGMLPRNVISNEFGTFLRIRNKGIYQWDKQQQTFIPLVISPVEELPLTDMVFTNKGQNIVWSTTNRGLFSFRIKDKKIQKLPLNNYPFAQDIANIEAYDDSTLIISDAINGISLLNIETGNMHSFTAKGGMLSNHNEAVVADNQAIIWTFSAEGINGIDAKKNRIVSIVDERLSQIQNICMKGNRLYAITKDLLFWIDTDSVKFPVETPQLYADYAMQSEGRIPWPNDANFKHTQNALTLYFGALTNNNLNGPHFQYKLNNEVIWHDLQQNHSLTLSNISAGFNELFIRVSGDTEENRWLKSSWTIRPAWYNSFMFYAFCLALGAGLLAFFLAQRLKTMKQKSALKWKINEYKTAALRAQMNPHFIFNCLSGIDNLILDNDIMRASDYLNKFARLLRSVLESSKNEVVPFHEDWQTTQWYVNLEQLRSNDRFTASFKADEEVLNGHYRIPPLIIQPCVENAIIHGLQGVNEGKLTVTAQISDNLLVFIIEDNGKGFANVANTEHKSYGLEMIKERVDLFNKGMVKNALEVISGEGRGTVVKIKLLV
ncbi:MAG: histidine kinase [Saprospiraceae bacterium]|nr:histidine kinase [Saprospiraceae bacterium]